MSKPKGKPNVRRVDIVLRNDVVVEIYVDGYVGVTGGGYLSGEDFEFVRVLRHDIQNIFLELKVKR